MGEQSTMTHPSPMPETETTVDHFICCEAPEDGSPTPTLCGLVSQHDGVLADEVGCVVCTDLERNDWCPLHGRCLWGEDDAP